MTAKSAPKTATPPRYHHGDARQALIAAAASCLESAGAAGLSLRQVAQAAGVSRQAPYNHFADKESLLAELVREGFAALGAGTAEAAATPGPRQERLRLAADFYVGFAQSRPALFRLMFSHELVNVDRHPAARAAATEAFAQLVELVASLAPAAQVADMTLVVWSLVHGYATLCLEAGLESPAQRAGRAALFARVLTASLPNPD